MSTIEMDEVFELQQQLVRYRELLRNYPNGQTAEMLRDSIEDVEQKLAQLRPVSAS